ncbi:MAG: site-specific DNA-methyltransferase [Blastochloris sp.]|nr:site-specific DNA-methyltransferase [Blastochloris sp.]
MKVYKTWAKDRDFTLYEGDCKKLIARLPDESVDLVLTSPPYCIGKKYEDKTEADDFEKDHQLILPEIVRVTKPGGSICWQVGYHIKNGVIKPLDFIIYQILSQYKDIHLRNRIIWTFGHGLHGVDRFSGRHETLLWFTKGATKNFNLDDIRTAQKYPGKKHYKGDKKGEFSGNPLGKNPSDVWEIPNVKANHVEKTEHPCQFPVALAERVIKAFTNPGDLVLDPYVGSGSTAAAAALNKRKFVGSELDSKYYSIAKKRVLAALDGILTYRKDDKPIYQPPANTPLTTVPSKWRNHPSYEKQIPVHSS